MNFKVTGDFIYLSGIPDGDVKKLGGTKTKKGIRFPKNHYCMRELVMTYPQLRENAEFVREGKTAYSNFESLQHLKEIEHPNCNELLRTYQKEDVHFLAHMKNALVLNEPRCGKTPTTIATIERNIREKNKAHKSSVLVVCPSSLVYNWKKEFELWFNLPHRVYVINGTKGQKEKQVRESVLYYNEHHNIVIISKDTLKSNDDYMSKLREHEWEYMIVDEAHFLRNRNSLQSKAVMSVNALRRYALTGTPAMRHASDVFGLLRFIEPQKYPSYWEWIERYFNVQENHWGGKEIGDVRTHRKEELRSLIDSVSVQRKRSDVMKWLPKQTRQNIPLVMTGKQEKTYFEMLETFYTELDDVEVDTQNLLAQLMRLRQICLDPRLLGLKAEGVKTQALLEYAEDTTEPFVVMTCFSSYYDLIQPELEKLGKKVARITGEIGQKERSLVAEVFQRGEIDVLLCNIIAAGTGLTLDRAETIVFMDKDFTPANNQQAEDRIVPTTKERYHPINILSFECVSSIDERINRILDEKLSLTEIIRKRVRV